MSQFIRLSLACTGLLLGITFVGCSTTPTATTPSHRMDPFRTWIGQWKGTGWMMKQDGTRIDFENSEHVEARGGGDVLIMEGMGVQPLPAGEQVTLHKGVTMVTLNTATGTYHWHGHEATRADADIESDLVLNNGHAVWSLQRGPATVRFTITVDHDHWHEIGEASTDGKQWSIFMECNMERVKR